MENFAVVSDIHANWEAMTAVFNDIEARGISTIYCLGDVIGYGANPIECLNKAFQKCKIILLGNHEEGVLKGAFGVNAAAKDAIDWTRSQLIPNFFSLPSQKKRWNRLLNFPTTHKEGEFFFAHGSPRDPTYEYLLPDDTQDPFDSIPEKIKENFKLVDKVCFVGHTHKPGIITEDSKWFDIEDFNYIWECKGKIICNVGSVGQPRDKDNRSCYVTVHSDKIFFHRIPYDWKTTQKKIDQVDKLDKILANRLETGT
jgi:predicted phosphodiesterase